MGTWYGTSHRIYIHICGTCINTITLLFLSVSFLCQWYDSIWISCQQRMSSIRDFCNIFIPRSLHYLHCRTICLLRLPSFLSVTDGPSKNIVATLNFLSNGIIRYCCFIISILIVRHSHRFLMDNPSVTRQFLSKTHLFGWHCICYIKLVTFFFVAPPLRTPAGVTYKIFINSFIYPTSSLCEFGCPSFDRDIFHLTLYSFINLIHIRCHLNNMPIRI